MTRRPNLTDPQRDRIAELTEEGGKTAEQIARAIGCSLGSVTWAQLKIGADPHPDRPLPPVPTVPQLVRRGDHVVRRFTQSEDEQLLGLEAAGWNPHSIARKLGRRANSITGRLRTLARRGARAEAAPTLSTPQPELLP